MNDLLKPLQPIAFFTAFLLLPFASCRQERQAAPIPPEAQQYVYAYTSGVISRLDPVRVRFTVSAAPIESIGSEAAADLLKFSPSIEGRLIWEDERTLRFEPAAPLASDAGYVATVALNKIIPEAPVAAASFQFDFQTRKQFFELEVLGLYAAQTADLSKQELRGRLYTADYADAEAVESMLRAEQAGRELPLTWTHSADQRLHEFSIADVQRGESPSEVALTWNGAPLGVELKDRRMIEVPAIGDFRVTDARSVSGDSPYLVVLFSDPLQPSQSLEGLVDIEHYDGQLRFLIEGQELRIFPAGRPVGDLTLRFSPGIRNLEGRRLGASATWTLHLEDTKPQVRLVGNGVIMPDSKGLIFPFDAIGLTAVDVEVFKVFDNNILQFLQSNRLDGNYQLREVGRIVLQQRIDLQALRPEAHPGEWTRYALDLGELIEQDPDAIYQVRLGFRQPYATYQCNEGANVQQALEIIEFEADEQGDPVSIMDYWYGAEGYYPGYRWEHRDDPCFSAYYNSDRFVARNVLASNLGLIAKGSDDRRFLFAVTDLRNTAPIAGATIALYDYQQQLLQTITTSGDGLAEATLERRPFVAVARQGSQKGYLRLQDGDALPLSQFDVGGAVTQKGLKGFLYGERGVWRPGDSVYLHFILEDENRQLPANYPVTFELIDPRGRLQERYATSQNVKRIYPLHFATPPGAPTGAWTARVKAGGATFEKRIRIETVKPNRLRVDLSFEDTPLSGRQAPVTAQLQVNWLHGAPAGNIKATIEATLRPGDFSPSAFPGFTFSDPTRGGDYQPITFFEGVLDAGGRARFTAPLFTGEEAPGMLVAAFRTEAFEPGGDFSTDYRTVDYHPYTAYAGLRLPANDFGEQWVAVGQEAPLHIAAADPAGKALAGRSLRVSAYRVDWRWWWEQGYDDISRFNARNQFNEVASSPVLATNTDGQATWTTRFDEWGRYLVRVCDEASGHCAAGFLYVGSPGYGEDAMNREAAAALKFRADQESYEVGQTVRLTIPTGREGRALITLENGSRVLQSFWSEAREGENEYSFQTTPEMAPTVYAHVTLLQPHGQAANDLPIRLYGVIPIRVEDRATVLEPELSMPEKLAPGQAFDLEVGEAGGKAMAYTVSIVDEGLLGLTRFQTPDPHDAFHAREALGIRTWDIYDQVLGAYGGKLERILSVGGDAALLAAGADERANRFQPVVRHLGPFLLKKGERARHRITLPNYVGAVRAMVVAAADGAYGSAESTVPVKQPVMVLPTLPRQLSPGERVRLPVSVFAMEENVKRATVTVEESNGLVNWTGPRRRQLDFERPGEGLLSFDFEVANRTGVARFTITGSGNGTQATQTVEVQVRNPNSIQTGVYSKVLAGSEEWRTDFEAIGLEGTNEAVLELSTLPPLNLEQRLSHLLSYPYGCIEQTVSAGFPQLYVDRLMELKDRQQQRAADNVRATIDRLRQFQTTQGGFAYWPGNDGPDQWSTSYAGHFMLEARRLGYTLPTGLFEGWLDFQQQAARMWTPRLSQYGYDRPAANQLNQAYRLYTLALAQLPDIAAMNRLRESDGLSRQARWRLAAAYTLAAQPEAARELVRELPTEVDDYRELSYTFGTATRDRAMILESLLLLDEEERAAQLLIYLAAELGSGEWMSTQTIAYSLLAISKYVGEEATPGTFSVSYQANEGQLVDAGSSNPVLQLDLPVSTGRSNRIYLRNQSDAKLFARLIVRGQPPVGATASETRDLALSVTYLDEAGQSIDPGRLAQGTGFIAEVRITHPGNRPLPYQELALSQLFPSGWEIINTRINEEEAGSMAGTTSPFDYQDIRDDRVHTFFDLGEGRTHVYRIRLNAAYAGRFFLPASSCEAMYDRTIFARSAGRWVEVVSREEL